jgi:hypothetical protein
MCVHLCKGPMKLVCPIHVYTQVTPSEKLTEFHERSFYENCHTLSIFVNVWQFWRQQVSRRMTVHIPTQCMDIWICNFFSPYWWSSPTWAMASSSLRFLGHTWHTKIHRTPLDKLSVCTETSTWQHTVLIKDKRSPLGFEPTIPGSK